MVEKVKEIICNFVEIDPDSISEEASLRYDVGATSFDLMNIAVEIEEGFGIKVPDSALPRIKTVGDIARLLEAAVS